MAYDSLRHQTLIFGGEGLSDPATLADTWLFDGSCWTQAHPANVPPGRDGAAIAFDPVVGRMLLYGGLHQVSNPPPPGYPTSLYDAWTWDGSDWMQLTANVPQMLRAAAAYDENLQKVVIAETGRTFTWDGVNWINVSLQAPPSQNNPGMCFDRPSKKIVYFGGSGLGTGASDQTWIWNGIGWTQLHPSVSPAARAAPALICGPTTILFGGTTGPAALGDTWTWDGAKWVPLHSAHSPDARVGAGGVYDGNRYLLLLGLGQEQSARSSPVTGTVWTYDGTDWSQNSNQQ